MRKSESLCGCALFKNKMGFLKDNIEIVPKKFKILPKKYKIFPLFFRQKNKFPPKKFKIVPKINKKFPSDLFPKNYKTSPNKYNIVPKFSKSTPKRTILLFWEKNCNFWEYFWILGEKMLGKILHFLGTKVNFLGTILIWYFFKANKERSPNN